MTATLPHLLRARAVEHPDRTALISTNGRELTFGEWDAAADSGAHALLGKGLQRGDRVGLLFPNDQWVDFAITCMAVLRAGGVAVPLSARQSAATLKVMTDDCAARWVLTEPLSGSGVPDVELLPDDPAQILYTSGTTGQPKGVMATHANLAWGARGEAAVPGVRPLGPLPARLPDRHQRGPDDAGQHADGASGGGRGGPVRRGGVLRADREVPDRDGVRGARDGDRTPRLRGVARPRPVERGAC